MVATPLVSSVEVVHAATTIDAQPATEVDELDRDILDVAANGRYALVAEWGLARPDARVTCSPVNARPCRTSRAAVPSPPTTARR